MIKPNFFIVGEPKCGTTAFYEFLREHPDVFVPENKEPHYFCKDFHEENRRHHGRLLHFQVQSEEQYLALFAGWRGERAVGEASVHYLYSTVAAREIHRFNPEARILVFLRNPVDFLHSWHSYAMLGDGEEITDFEAALAAETARRRGEGLTPLMRVPSYLFYSELVKFADHIGRYLDLFGRDRLHVIIYDDLKADVAATYRGVLEFLEVDPEYRPEFRVVNANKRLRFGKVVRLTKLPRVRQSLRLLFPKSLRRRIGLPKVYDALFHVRENRVAMRPETRRRLMEQTLPEVEALSELIGRDLVHLWGYDTVPAY